MDNSIREILVVLKHGLVLSATMDDPKIVDLPTRSAPANYVSLIQVILVEPSANRNHPN